MLFSLITLLSTVAVAAAAPGSISVDPIRKVYTFPDAPFIENIVVRSNGDLIITSLSHPRVYTIDPRAKSPTPHLLTTISSPTVNVTAGIAEYARDRFAVVGALFDLSTFSAWNVSVWTIDARRSGISPVVVKVVDIPEAGLANGLTTLPGVPDVVLISDSRLGALWRVNLLTGTYELVVQDTLFVPNPTGLPLGINGIRVFKSHLWFVNANKGFLAKVPISRDGRKVTLKDATQVSTISVGQGGYDDFAVDAKGRLWIATHPDAIDIVAPSGKQTILGGFNVTANGLGPTSAAFGRGCKKEEQTLYVVGADGVVFAVDTDKVKLN